MVLRPVEERGGLVLVRKKEGALFWCAPSSPVETSDAPGMPSSTIIAADAVALVKTAQKAVATPDPVTLRGQWSGTLTCDGGAPRVELVQASDWPFVVRTGGAVDYGIRRFSGHLDDFDVLCNIAEDKARGQSPSPALLAVRAAAVARDPAFPGLRLDAWDGEG